MDEILLLLMALCPVVILCGCVLGFILYSKVEAMESKKRTQQIISNNVLSAYEKGRQLLKECDLSHHFYHEKYADELCELTWEYLKENNLKLSDYL